LQTDKNIFFIHRALEVAERSMLNGNLPFGCILVDARGTIIEEGENTVISTKDNIAHCEINVAHQLAGKYDWEYLNQCTVFASTEPCAMCAAAIYWSGIGKLVYGLSKEKYHEVAHTDNPNHILNVHAEELLARGGRKMDHWSFDRERNSGQIFGMAKTEFLSRL